MTIFRRLSVWLLPVVLFPCLLLAQAPDPVPVPPSQMPNDLITPINKEPISIDKALEKGPATAKKTARNVIFYILDGLSASGMHLARKVIASGPEQLSFDRFPTTARVYGEPQDALILDSAAAASAYTTGKPGFLHRLAVDRDGKPLTTLWEAAKKKGFRVGLVTDTRITHATPAAFAAHHQDREKEYEIAAQMLDSSFDVLLGGGRKYFQPASGTDLLEKARGLGYRVLSTRSELSQAPQQPGKVLGLFHPSFMSFTFEAGYKDEPSLREMSAAALSLLESSQDRFLLMIEAGKIDSTMHAHDPAEFISQMRIAEDTLRTLQDYVSQHPETLLIMVPDHSTGGLSVTEKFDPIKFKALATSTIAMSREFKGHADGLAAAFQARFPGLAFSNEEVKSVAQQSEHYEFDAALGSLIYGKLGLHYLPFELQTTMEQTDGHCGEDLFLHATGARSELFNGVLRSWDIPGRIASALAIEFP